MEIKLELRQRIGSIRRGIPTIRINKDTAMFTQAAINKLIIAPDFQVAFLVIEVENTIKPAIGLCTQGAFEIVCREDNGGALSSSLGKGTVDAFFKALNAPRLKSGKAMLFPPCSFMVTDEHISCPIEMGFINNQIIVLEPLIATK